MKEQDIQKCILDYLAAEHIFAFRLNTGGAKVHGGFLRSHSLGAGAADILAMPRICESGHRNCLELSGKFHGEITPTWIEVKNTKGRQSAEQKSFQEYVEGLGHRYILARSVDDVREMWQERCAGK